MKYYQKTIDSPFAPGSVNIYADSFAAINFHTGLIHWLLFGIRESNKSDIMSEDAEISLFIITINNILFKVNYQLKRNGNVRSLKAMIEQYGDEGRVYKLSADETFIPDFTL